MNFRGKCSYVLAFIKISHRPEYNMYRKSDISTEADKMCCKEATYIQSKMPDIIVSLFCLKSSDDPWPVLYKFPTCNDPQDPDYLASAHIWSLSFPQEASHFLQQWILSCAWGFWNCSFVLWE